VARRFQVRITISAERDVLSIENYIARDKPQAAAKWARTILKRIASLRHLPFRYEVIPEELNLELEYRHIVFGNYRIIFRVDGSVVWVVRVFHAARILTTEHLHEDLSR
jgi:toxin ParE1/3/4